MLMATLVVGMTGLPLGMTRDHTGAASSSRAEPAWHPREIDRAKAEPVSKPSRGPGVHSTFARLTPMGLAFFLFIALNLNLLAPPAGLEPATHGLGS